VSSIVNHFVVALVVLAIAIIFVDIKNITDERTQCLKNSLVYGVNKWQEANNNFTFLCRCSFLVPNSPTIIVTNKNLTINYPDKPDTFENFDYGNITEKLNKIGIFNATYNKV